MRTNTNTYLCIEFGVFMRTCILRCKPATTTAKIIKSKKYIVLLGFKSFGFLFAPQMTKHKHQKEQWILDFGFFFIFLYFFRIFKCNKLWICDKQKKSNREAVRTWMRVFLMLIDKVESINFVLVSFIHEAI